MNRLAPIALAVALTATPAIGQKTDLSAMTCKQFAETSQQSASFIVVWLHGFYTTMDDPPVVDIDKATADAGKLRDYCTRNPDVGLTTAADEVLN